MLKQGRLWLRASGEGVPLLEQEGWLRREEKDPVPKRRRRGGRSHEVFRRTDHPVRAFQGSFAAFS